MPLPDPRSVSRDIESRLATNRRALEQARSAPVSRRDDLVVGLLARRIRHLEDHLRIARVAEAHGGWPAYAEKSLSSYLTQPRAPAGQDNGGQWVSAGGGGGSAVSQGKPVRVAQMSVARSLSDALLFPFAGSSLSNPKTFDNAADAESQYYLEQERNRSQEQVPFLLYERSTLYGVDGSEVVRTGIAQKEDVVAACKSYGLIQSKLDEIVAATPRSDFRSAQAYGTEIHRQMDQWVKSLGSGDLWSEYSVTRDREAGHYGQPGTIRLDIHENVRDRMGAPTGTGCTYDIKTGVKELDQRRSDVLAGMSTRIENGGYQRIFFVEVRPSPTQ